MNEPVHELKVVVGPEAYEPDAISKVTFLALPSQMVAANTTISLRDSVGSVVDDICGDREERAPFLRDRFVDWRVAIATEVSADEVRFTIPPDGELYGVDRKGRLIIGSEMQLPVEEFARGMAGGTTGRSPRRWSFYLCPNTAETASLLRVLWTGWPT